MYRLCVYFIVSYRNHEFCLYHVHYSMWLKVYWLNLAIYSALVVFERAVPYVIKKKNKSLKKNDIVVHFQYLIVFLFYKQISKWPADVPPVKLKKCPVRHVKSIACTAKYFYLFVFFILSTIRANVSFYKNSNRSLHF